MVEQIGWYSQSTLTCCVQALWQAVQVSAFPGFSRLLDLISIKQMQSLVAQ